MGPAEAYLYPPPLNFTILKGRGSSGGILYYQIMNGITGTAMPYFKRELESEKIWDVGNYVAVTFIGETDAGAPPKGIPAAYEPVGRAQTQLQPEKVIRPTEQEEAARELSRAKSEKPRPKKDPSSLKGQP